MSGRASMRGQRKTVDEYVQMARGRGESAGWREDGSRRRVGEKAGSMKPTVLGRRDASNAGCS